MKTKTKNPFAGVHKVALLGVVCVLLLAVASCKNTKDIMEEEIINVPITELSLSETSCRWIVLGWSDVVWSDEWMPGTPWWMYTNSVVIINSNEGLKKYIECVDGSHPDIDFSKQTLLLVRGVAPANVASTGANLYQTGKGRYTLNVNVQLGIAAIIEGWAIGVLIPKISDDANIILKVEVD